MQDLATPKRSLAGAGVLVALVAATLIFVGLATPAPGLAASESAQRLTVNYAILPSATEATTATVFLPFVVRTTVMPNVWAGEYYANMNLSGDPAFTTTESQVDHDWGVDAPEGLPKNYFSARWTGGWDFEYGEYTFFVFADDGVRLWLDDQLLINQWQAGGGFYSDKVIVGTEGRHRLKLEYFEQTGGATIRLHWRRTDLYPMWSGEYFTQPWVEFGKAYEQKDPTIQFDWEHGCPLGLPCDDFSVRWKATPVFVTGTHRIYLYADDGYQLWVDGNKVREGGWYDGQTGSGEDETYDLQVNGLQHHEITYNFHDRGDIAEARLWIQDLEHPYWTAEYYNNMSLAGAPVTTKQEAAIYYDWKWDKPRPKLPGDHFSVRWRGQRYFHAGSYRFGFFVDDGVRLWIDGELLLDEWHDGRTEYHAPVTYLGTGYHDFVVEYYDNEGEAEIRFWFE